MRETCICERPIALADLGLREVLGEAQAQDLALARRDDPHDVLDGGAVLGQGEAPLLDADDVAQRVGAVVVGAPWRLQRRGPVGARGLERLEDVLRVSADLRPDLLDRRLALELEVELGDRAVDLQREVLEVARHADRPGAVAEVALDLAQDGRHRIAREGDPAVEAEAVDGVDEAEAGDLEEVVEGLVGALVAARELARERQEALDEHLAVDRVALVEVACEQGAILRDPRSVVRGVADWPDMVSLPANVAPECALVCSIRREAAL